MPNSRSPTQNNPSLPPETIFHSQRSAVQMNRRLLRCSSENGRMDMILHFVKRNNTFLPYLIDLGLPLRVTSNSVRLFLSMTNLLHASRVSHIKRTCVRQDTLHQFHIFHIFTSLHQFHIFKQRMKDSLERQQQQQQ
jgi:hypothetical protein